MIEWTPEIFENTARYSTVLHGNRHTLPVAAAAVELPSATVKAPEIATALRGQVPPNRVLDGLHRLCMINALKELPYPGRPAPRLFERVDHPYWALVRATAEAIQRDQASS